jgi:hypothetical protein
LTLEQNGYSHQDRVKCGAYYRRAVEALRLLGGAVARYPRAFV